MDAEKYMPLKNGIKQINWLNASLLFKNGFLFDYLNSFKSEAFASLAYYPYRLSAFKFVIACVVLYCKFISEERVESKKSLF